jgi:hypothetical protein
MSPSKRRSRFLLKTVGVQTSSSMLRPTNQRNNRLYCSCSISSRSLRTVYSACNNKARSSCSGGTDGRPMSEYSRSKRGDNRVSTVSVICRIGRNGWSAGTRSFGDR